MENNQNIIVIGDVSVDVFILPKKIAHFDGQISSNTICFPKGEKIPVEHFDLTCGGNAGNIAIGLSRLGQHVSLVTTFGADELSELIKKQLLLENVDISSSKTQKTTATNYATIFLSDGERTIFSYHAKKTYAFPDQELPQVSYVYLTSMGEQFAPFYASVLSYVKNHPNIQLLFNPGSVQMHEPFANISDIISHSSYLFINREEGEQFAQFPNSRGNEKALFQKLHVLCPNTIVVTDAKDGSYVYTNETLFHMNALPAGVVDKTGAGDAFNSGFISAICEQKTIEEALLRGTMNASSVVGFISAQKGLLRTNDLASWEKIAQTSAISARKVE